MHTLGNGVRCHILFPNVILQCLVLRLEVLDLGLVLNDFVVLHLDHVLLLAADGGALEVPLVQLLVALQQLAVSFFEVVYFLDLLLQVDYLLPHPLDHLRCYEHSWLVLQFRGLQR